MLPPSPEDIVQSTRGSTNIKRGQFKVTVVEGPQGYTIKYSPQCSGYAESSEPFKCTISASIPGPRPPPRFAQLTIENFVSATCPEGKTLSFRGLCPQGSNTKMITTIDNYILPQSKIEFIAGNWGEVAKKVINIPIGSEYKISTRVGQTSFGHTVPGGTLAFRFNDVYIAGIRNGCTAGPSKLQYWDTGCSDKGAEIKVAYYWTRFS